MKTVLQLLRNELREWKQQQAHDKKFWKAYTKQYPESVNYARAEESLNESKLHIAELKAAIKKLSER